MWNALDIRTQATLTAIVTQNQTAKTPRPQVHGVVAVKHSLRLVVVKLKVKVKVKLNKCNLIDNLYL